MKQNILILGAGRSSGSLISYLHTWCNNSAYSLVLADLDSNALDRYQKSYPHITTRTLDAQNPLDIEKSISNAAMVISLLPASMHPKIAKLCIKHFKNLATASYATEELKALAKKAEVLGLTFLFEMGVDPGIDHMSSVQMIEKVKALGGHILGFKSFSGALLSPQTETGNPWKYKFTWNPRNVVLVGQNALAQYRLNANDYYVPYMRLFKELWHVEFDKLGTYEAYANRNSLQYNHHYGLHNLDFLVRGTLRRPGFCEAWNALVHLGATHNTTTITLEQDSTIGAYFSKLLKSQTDLDSKEAFEKLLGFTISVSAWERIVYLDLLGATPLKKGDYTPAQVLEQVLLNKWKLEERDRDMVVMYHEITYQLRGQTHRMVSRMHILGENAHKTAISSTVGLPLAMGVKLILENKITEKGLVLPVLPHIYEPILKELAEYQIHFSYEDQVIH